MITEIVAARLVARHLGFSLYTWTSVIGVVLCGITIGSWMGGRLADKWTASKTLSSLLVAGSFACLFAISANNFAVKAQWLWERSWPVHVGIHVIVTFFLPSFFLGTAPPILTKMALERSTTRGRILGITYAWFAAGNVAGVILGGFLLIPLFGSFVTICTIASITLIIALTFYPKSLFVYAWLITFITLLFVYKSQNEWARSIISSLALREKVDKNIIYKDETEYSHITIKRVLSQPDKRIFIQDKLIHGTIIIDDVNNLCDPYSRIFAAITKKKIHRSRNIASLVIGGGGYVFPRYLKKNWPESTVDVVEIDPKVTKAANKAFGFVRNCDIQTYHMDGRCYVNYFSNKTKQSDRVKLYSFIYMDAFNDYSIPFQLVTKEFNDKIYNILKPDGIYMVNLVDYLSSAQLLKSVVITIENTFPYVQVLYQELPIETRNTFVIVASKNQLDLPKSFIEKNVGFEINCSNISDLNKIAPAQRGILLTDNYAPVEQLLAPTIIKSAPDVMNDPYKNNQ